jgi:hypothetical protein
MRPDRRPHSITRTDSQKLLASRAATTEETYTLPAIVILCCVRSQREKCGSCEKIGAAAQRFNWPFVDVAA